MVQGITRYPSQDRRSAERVADTQVDVHTLWYECKPVHRMAQSGPRADTGIIIHETPVLRRPATTQACQSVTKFNITEKIEGI